jgi:class 3 adenylate cyclase
VLADAVGTSEYAIVAIGDIRGFSDFSDDLESPEVATYIREVFIHMIDEYFPFATFFKSTGDGLLITTHFNRNNVVDMMQKTVSGALRCVRDFPTMCDNNPMITFPTPDKIGFGISRGTTCCFVSNERIIDYSGHMLNLTSRLMDLARPGGVVLDGVFGRDLLDEATRNQFEPAEAFVRGLAEETPHKIFIQSGEVVLPEYALHPLTSSK